MAKQKEQAVVPHEPVWMRQKRAAALKLGQTLPEPEGAYACGSFEPLRVKPGEFMRPSPHPEATVISFEEAYAQPKFEAILKKNVFSLVGTPEDKALAIHCASVNRGMLVVIPEGKKMSVPVRIQTVLGSASIFEHLVVIAEAGSSAELELVLEGGAEAMHSQVVEVFAANGASLTVTAFQQAGLKARIFSRQYCRQEGFSRIHWLDSRFGSACSCIRAKSLLKEPGCEFMRQSVYGGASGVFDIAETATLQARQSSGRIVSHAALDGTAKASHQAKITIDQAAAQSVADEQLHAVILSNKAQMCPIPVLEVKHSDVQAHHSASVGHIDEDQLFYLESRTF